jgi:hypothetical protein
MQHNSSLVNKSNQLTINLKILLLQGSSTAAGIFARLLVPAWVDVRREGTTRSETNIAAAIQCALLLLVFLNAIVICMRAGVLI